MQKQLLGGSLPISATIRKHDAQRGILLKLPGSSVLKEWKVLTLTGLSFDPPLHLPGEGYGLSISLTDPKALDIFATLCGDLITVTADQTSAESAAKALAQRISHWCRFLQKRTAQLSEEEVRGLIGELSVLHTAAISFGMDPALDSWKGPAGELHDFHLDTFRLEAKTWFNKDLPRISVSDPHQVMADPFWPVWFAVLQLGISEHTGMTLPAWVGKLSAMMDESQIYRFEGGLANAGYLSAQAEHYSKRYAVLNTEFYKITETFPRLETTSIPAGITSVRYAIELNALDKFRMPSPFQVNQNP